MAAKKKSSAKKAEPKSSKKPPAPASLPPKSLRAPKSKSKSNSKSKSKSDPMRPGTLTSAPDTSPTAKKGQTAEYTFDGNIVVTCSNVDRRVFNQAGITKGDLIAYYNDIAPCMLPELVGRPLSLERFTKGLGGGGFFQKHFQKHFPDWINKVELGTKTKVIYPTADDAASLVYLTNQGSISFHIGTSRRGSVDYPDAIIFDLDPPRGDFELAKQAARAVKGVLDEIDLPAFLKTTGSKGLHIFVPTDGKATYEEVQDLCKRINAKLTEAHPDLLTTAFYKAHRKGRLFLDVMRNGLGATVVAPWSVRGRPTAPVSCPIEWEELEDPNLKPDGITLRDVRARLDAKGNAWAKFRVRLGSVATATPKLPEVSGAMHLAQMVSDDRAAASKSGVKSKPKSSVKPKSARRQEIEKAPHSKREPI